MLRAPALALLLLPILTLADGDSPSAVKLSKEEKDLFDLVNKERKKEKLPLLTVNATLCKAARLHSENMARQEKMDHKLDGKSPGQRVDDAGYDYRVVRENLGTVSGSDDGPPPPTDVHEKWMESKGHKANILHAKVTEIGLSVVRSKKGTYYYTQVFASPRN